MSEPLSSVPPDDGYGPPADPYFALRVYATYPSPHLDADAAEALRRLLQERDDLTRERDAWEEFASHQEWCSACAEDGVSRCHTGGPLQEAAKAFAASRSPHQEPTDRG